MKYFWRGFTLIELLVTIAVGAVILTVVVGAFSNAPGIQAVDKGRDIVLSLIDQARNQTLSAKNAAVYGVHFETTKAVLFSGTTYSSGASGNIVEKMSPLVQISGISLADGGSEVVFDRLTGRTSKSGTITISLIASSTQNKTITIFATGLAQSN